MPTLGVPFESNRWLLNSGSRKRDKVFSAQAERGGLSEPAYVFSKAIRLSSPFPLGR